MALTSLQVTNVCTANIKGNFSPCRYLLSTTDAKFRSYLCTRLAPKIAADLIKREPYRKRCSVNCSGYLYLKHKAQGYDVP